MIMTMTDPLMNGEISGTDATSHAAAPVATVEASEGVLLGSGNGMDVGLGSASDLNAAEAIAIPVAKEDAGGDGDWVVDAVATILPDNGKAIAVEVAGDGDEDERKNRSGTSSLKVKAQHLFHDDKRKGEGKVNTFSPLSKKKNPSGPGFLKRRQLPLSKRKLPMSRSISPLAQRHKGSTLAPTSSPTNTTNPSSLSPSGAPSANPDEIAVKMNSPSKNEATHNNTQPSDLNANHPPPTSTQSTKEKLKKFKPSMARPTLATPSIVSEKRILLHAGPAESLPPGWTIKHYKRTTGLKHTDRYWFSPLLKKKFRSLAQVGRFLDFLNRDDVNGDETKAWELFRTSPPGPDEIRSRNRIPGAHAPPNLKKKAAVTYGILGSPSHASSSSNQNVTNSNGSGSGSGSDSLYGTSSSNNGGGSASGTSSHHSSSNSKHGGHRPWRLPLIASPGLHTIPPPSILQKYKRQIEQQAKNKDPAKKDNDNNEKKDAAAAAATTASSSNGDTNQKRKAEDKDEEQQVERNESPKIELNEQGYITPSLLFDQAIIAAGFTQDKLNAATYKGSSLRRTVDDMFDSDIRVEGMELVPKDLWNMTAAVAADATTEASTKDDFNSCEHRVLVPNNSTKNSTVKDVAMRAEECSDMIKNGDAPKRTPNDSAKNICVEDSAMKLENGSDLVLKIVKDGQSPATEKKHRLRRDDLCDALMTIVDTEKLKHSRYHQFKFEEMIPTSLTRKLPEEFRSKQRQYYQDVKKREEVLEMYRNQKEENENLMDEYENSMDEWRARKDYYEHKKMKAKKVKEAAAAKMREIEEKKMKKEVQAKEAQNTKVAGSETGDEKKDATETAEKEKVVKNEQKQGSNFAKTETKDEAKKIDDSEKDDDSRADEKGHPGPQPTPPIIKPLVKIPKIPIPPVLAAKMIGTTTQQSEEGKKGTTTSCIPAEKRHLVMHFDPDSFEIHGRYYGLLTNTIADPQYVGPNAPGIAGVNSSGGTGLATTYTGSTAASERISGNSSNTSMSAMAENENASSPNKKGVKKGSKGSSTKINSSSLPKSTPSKAKKARVGPPPTSTSVQLKKIMDQGGNAAEGMRQSIIRAAVYACRTGTHSGSFVGSTGETYPDISKAFSNHAKCRPCSRCKNNKQGAYHCRLKRKHTETDYDGGNSASVLSALFGMPLKELVPHQTEKKMNNVED